MSEFYFLYKSIRVFLESDYSFIKLNLKKHVYWHYDLVGISSLFYFISHHLCQEHNWTNWKSKNICSFSQHDLDIQQNNEWTSSCAADHSIDIGCRSVARVGRRDRRRRATARHHCRPASLRPVLTHPREWKCRQAPSHISNA